MAQITPTEVTTALFRLSVLEPIVSRDTLNRGELESIIHTLSQREYTIPNSARRHVGEKTIQSWYYAWRRNGVVGLTPKVRIDRGQSKLSSDVQNSILNAKKENPKLSIAKIINLISSNTKDKSNRLSKSTVHRLLQSQGMSQKIDAFDERIEKHFEIFNECFKNASKINSSKESMLLSFRWMLNALQNKHTSNYLYEELGSSITKTEIEELVHHIRFDALPGRNRAIIILSRLKNIQNNEIGDFLAVSPAVVSNSFQKYISYGLPGLFGPRKVISKKSENQMCKDEVFALLHSPPRDHDINRTSWTLRMV